MFIDSQLHFHDKTAVTGPGDYDGDALALPSVGSFEGIQPGEPLEVYIQVTTAFASGTGVTFRLVTATDAAGTDATDQITTGLVVTAAGGLALGKKIRVPFVMTNPDIDATHVSLQAEASGTHTAGAFSAWIQRVGEDQDSY